MQQLKDTARFKELKERYKKSECKHEDIDKDAGCLKCGEYAKEENQEEDFECPHNNTEWRDENGESYLNCFDCGDVLRTK